MAWATGLQWWVKQELAAGLNPAGLGYCVAFGLQCLAVATPGAQLQGPECIGLRNVLCFKASAIAGSVNLVIGCIPEAVVRFNGYYDVYSHVLPGMQEAAALALDEKQARK